MDTITAAVIIEVAKIAALIVVCLLSFFSLRTSTRTMTAVREVEHNTNAKMDLMLVEIAKASKAEGKLEEKTEEEARQASRQDAD